ncbi:MAG: Lrp/AsnC family transcriptional regulator [Candidatus Micrarchaeaceae archaeon]
MLDLISEKLLALLERNADMTNQELASKLGLTEGAVRKRIKKLESERIVIGYKARIRYQVADKTMLIVGLDIAPERFNDVISRLKERKEIAELYATTGDHAAIFVASTGSSNASNFIREIERMDGIRRVYPAFVQDVVK